MAPIMTTGAGAYAVAAPSYTGPGDTLSYNLWGGFRAYSAAAAAGTVNAIDIYDNNTINSSTFSSTIKVKTDGTLDTAAITTFMTAHSLSTVYVGKIYDQSGNSNDLVPIANSSTLHAYGSSSIINNGTAKYLRATGITSSQFLCTGVFMSNTGTNDSCGFWGSGTSDVRGTIRGTNLFGIYNGTGFVTQGGMTTGVYHAVQSVLNGASSVVRVDGTSSSAGNTGSTSLSDFRIGYDGAGGAVYMNGGIKEIGVITGVTAVNTAVETNTRTFWGI